MNQRTFLELTHNPFTPPREGFFGGADRRMHLDQIRHLSQWSRRILMVTGPFGIGKSTLYRELSSNLEPSTKAARLSGAVVTSDREIVLGIAQGFGVAVDAVAHIDEIVEVLARHITEEQERGLVGAVLIDDAQLLDFAAINALIGLVAVAPLRLVLFAEATMIANLNKVTKKHELEWFEIRLTGFPAADVRDYLEWRFSQAQYRGRLPFTDEQVEQIRQRSGGNPNVIDFMANELLSDLETGGQRSRTLTFPRRHLLLAVVLVVLVGLLYQLYRQPSRETVVVQTTEMASSDKVIETAQELRAAESTLPSSVGELESAVDAQPDEPQAREEMQAAESAGRDEAEQAVDSGNAESAVGTGEVATEPEESGVDVTVADVTVPERPIDDTLPVTAAGSTESSAQAEDAPEPIAPPSISTSEPVDAAAPVEVVTSEDGLNGVEWIKRQNGAHYTLQLMTLSKREGGAALIKRQAEPDEFALYPVIREGRTFYILVYGVYSSQESANAARLTGELASIKPWVRRFATIQDSLN